MRKQINIIKGQPIITGLWKKIIKYGLYWKDKGAFSQYSIRTKGLDHRFVQKDITTSLQDLKSFEYYYRWLKHTGYTHPIPYGIF